MLPINKLQIPGEHKFFFENNNLCFESIVAIPPIPASITPLNHCVALLGHPHSLYGGSMDNKVVTTIARACKDLNIVSLRFNFRGVGQSQGVYDAGIGESEDMLKLASLWIEHFPKARFLFTGFSFGSYVAYRAAALHSHDLLLTIAPPVHNFNYQEFSPPPNSWYIFQGDKDEIVKLEDVLQFAKAYPEISVSQFATGHFFHGKLLSLKDSIIELFKINLQ